MFTAILIALTAILGLVIGYITREIREILKRIEFAIKLIVHKQQTEEAQEIAKKKGMSFGDPMTMAELANMEDEERIAAINADM